MSENVRDALVAGLSALRNRGLAKFTLADAEGRVCSRGALLGGDLRAKWGKAHEQADTLLSEVASEQYPDRVDLHYGAWPITCFNNHPDTTQEDVERVFEKAIMRAEEVA